MTADSAEENVLQVIRTVKGNHARGHFNQREIDVIAQEVMPAYHDEGTVGIITPYRVQAAEINQALKQDIASTVHKYQGRECETIIMSMVDNEPTEFSDDAKIEVDGWKFHKGSEVQQSRDGLKNQILMKCGLRLKRISTTDTINENNASNLISRCLG